MLAFSNTFKDIDEFLRHILLGLYDRELYSYFYQLAMRDGIEIKSKFDPTELFEFSIKLADCKEHMYISPWNISGCKKWDIELTQKERKVVLLLIAVIRDIYDSLPSYIKAKYERGLSHA